MISGYFDTNIGLKTEAKSYLTISEEIGVEPNKILFLTDVERGTVVTVLFPLCILETCM